nr:DUF1868 domain-containing protein [uncultured Cohaesibacter sp.]
MQSNSWSMPEPKRGKILSLLTGKDIGGAHPPAITAPDKGGKFTPDGTVLPFPGNTFICHINQNTAFFEALCTMQDHLRASRYADWFSFLPKASFHMTVFCGVCGDPLGQDGWPEGLPAGSDLATTTRHFIDTLEQKRGEAGFKVKPTGLVLPATIEMEGLNPVEEGKLRQTRALLEDVTGIRRGDIDSYGFHVSMAYPIRWLTTQQADSVMKEAEALFEALLRDIGPVDLGPVELCLFETMHRYETIGILDPEGYSIGKMTEQTRMTD